MNLKLTAEISADYDDQLTTTSPTSNHPNKLPGGNPYYRQHSRNRSLDSAQVLSCFHQAESELGSPVHQLPHHEGSRGSLSTKSNSPSVLVNDRILNMRQQHCCLYHDYRTVTGESHHHHNDLPPATTTNKLKCTCAASSDDSGICSGASGTTGSETDDLNCSVACDTYEEDDDDVEEEEDDMVGGKAQDSSVDSPRLSFDSAILTDDHEEEVVEDVDDDLVQTAAAAVIAAAEDSGNILETELDGSCLEVDHIKLSLGCNQTSPYSFQSGVTGGGDLDLTLINDELSTPRAGDPPGVPISTLVLDSSDCSSTGPNGLYFGVGEMDQQQQATEIDAVGVSDISAGGDNTTTCVESVVDSPASTVSAVPPPTPSNSTGVSLLSRIRGNKSNNSSSSTTPQTSGNNGGGGGNSSTSSATSAVSSTSSSMRSKLRLNFGKGKEKSKQQGSANTTTPVVTEQQQPQESLKTPSESSSGAAAAAAESANVAGTNSANNKINSERESEEEKLLSVEEFSGTESKFCDADLQINSTQSTQVTLSKPKSWLLRFFESQVFNMSYAIGYLFTSKEPGVQQYIGK